MKKYILFIVFTLCLFTVNAQDFEETAKYTVKNEMATKQQENGSSKMLTIALAETSEKIATVSFADSYMFDALRISVLERPELKDIVEVIKVELEYSAYSVEIDTYYFLVTNKGSYVALPKVTKVFDDILQPIEDYIFPVQKYGQEETIIRAEFKYTNNYTNEEIEVLQSFAWNDDDFDSKEAVTVIQ